MKNFFRFGGALFLLALACGSFALFEYLKLLESDWRYIEAGIFTLISLFGSLLLLLGVERFRIKKSINWATLIIILLAVGEGGFLRSKSQNELNRALNSRGRCESVLVELFRDNFDGVLKNAQNVCTFRILREGLTYSAVGQGEAKIREVMKLLRYEDRLDETGLVLMLSFYSTLESKRPEKSDVALDLLKNEFNYVEGSIALFEIYRVKAFFGGEISANMEQARMNKLLELSTLGQSLRVFMSRARGAIEAYQALLNGSQKGLPLEGGELTLMGIRVQRIKEGFTRVVNNWRLLEALETLNLKDTYADQYEKVRKVVTYEAL